MMELTIGFAIGTLIIGIIGIVSHVVSEKDDTVIEEASEQIVEHNLEQMMNLKEGTLEGKIDFSHKSPEKKKD